jgi:hypothetical protein
VENVHRWERTSEIVSAARSCASLELEPASHRQQDPRPDDEVALFTEGEAGSDVALHPVERALAGGGHAEQHMATSDVVLDPAVRRECEYLFQLLSPLLRSAKRVRCAKTGDGAEVRVRVTQLLCQLDRLRRPGSRALGVLGEQRDRREGRVGQCELVAGGEGLEQLDRLLADPGGVGRVTSVQVHEREPAERVALAQPIAEPAVGRDRLLGRRLGLLVLRRHVALVRAPLAQLGVELGRARIAEAKRSPVLGGGLAMGAHRRGVGGGGGGVPEYGLRVARSLGVVRQPRGLAGRDRALFERAEVGTVEDDPVVERNRFLDGQPR